MPTAMAAAPYEIRTGGDGKSKKQSMAELKLRRLTELNQRLREATVGEVVRRGE